MPLDQQIANAEARLVGLKAKKAEQARKAAAAKPQPLREMHEFFVKEGRKTRRVATIHLQRDRGGCTVSGWREGDEDEVPRLFYAATSRDEAWRIGKTWAEAQAKESGHG